MDFREQTIADFEEEGVASVRLRVQAGLVATTQVATALEWLREKVAEAARHAERERLDDAASAKREKTTANAVNVALIVITSLGLIVAIASWLFPRT